MTKKVKEIVSAYERLDAAEKEQVRRHLAKNGKTGGKTANPLTNGRGNGYNASVSTGLLKRRKPSSVGCSEARRIGKRIKTLMLERDENQSRVAAATGICRASINRYVGGLRKPIPAHREKLEAHFGAPIDSVCD